MSDPGRSSEQATVEALSRTTPSSQQKVFAATMPLQDPIRLFESNKELAAQQIWMETLQFLPQHQCYEVGTWVGVCATRQVWIASSSAELGKILQKVDPKMSRFYIFQYGVPNPLVDSDHISRLLTHEHITSDQHDLSKLTTYAREQCYAFLSIVDFEASINEADGTHEMTEFPLVLLSTATPSLDVVDEFHTFVRPQRNENWRNDKGIPQSRFDESPAFPEVWQDLLKFLDQHGATESNTLAVTCGDWDFRAMLPAEQSFHGIDRLPLFENWCNIKHAFKSFTGKKADSMVRMLNVVGQELIGTHHSGIDDARNIAGIARWLLQQGYVFKITSDGSVDEQALQHQQILKREKAEVNQAVEAARIAKLSAGATSPKEMFLNDSSFSVWDGDGIPTHLADGMPMSKSAINKRKKMWKAQQLLHEKYLVWRQTQV
ncbi:ribonuclease H-like domain-containing protein [Tricladium varicosporioides]|nr:ribonuclease H-like domain-containing protein [Hymenoscyphus varicosporioides]